MHHQSERKIPKCLIVTLLRNAQCDRILSQNIEAFTEAGYDVVVTELIHKEEEVPPHFVGVRLLISGKALVLQAVKYLEWFARVIKIIVDTRPTILYSWNLEAAWPIILARWLSGSVITVLGYYELRSETSYARLRGFLRFIEKVLMPKFDCVIVGSRGRAEFIVNRIGARIRTRIERFYPPDDLNQLCSDDCLSERFERKEILYLGTIMRSRGLETIIKGIKYLPAAYRLSIVGSMTTYVDELLDLIEELELRERVSMLGFMSGEDLYRALKTASLGVVCYENTSLNNYYCVPAKLYEYVQAGLPVVSSNQPDMVREVQDSGIGVCFDPQDPMSFAAAVSDVLGVEKGRYSRFVDACTGVAFYKSWEAEKVEFVEFIHRLGEGGN